MTTPTKQTPKEFSMPVKTMTKSIPLLVTTLHKGVFFGWGQKTDEKNITLTDCQMCVSWSADMRGVFGLAALGPSSGCRISPPVPEMLIHDITSIAVCTPESAEAWKKAGEKKW